MKLYHNIYRKIGFVSFEMMAYIIKFFFEPIQSLCIINLQKLLTPLNAKS